MISLPPPSPQDTKWLLTNVRMVDWHCFGLLSIFRHVSGSIQPDLYQKKDAVLRQESKEKTLGRLHVRLKYDFHTSDLIVHLIEGK